MTTLSTLPVLLLDPTGEWARGLALRLESAGFATRIEDSVTAVLRAMRHEFFGTLIVITDLNRPGCFTEIHDLRRRAAHTWIIVVSSRCDTTTRNRVFRHGGDACIAAPVSTDELTTCLRGFQTRSRPSF